MTSEEPFTESTWNLGIHDAHCHPTDTMSKATIIPSMKAKSLTVMGTRQSDLPLVASLAKDYPEKVVPSFGHHPWFSYLVYDDTGGEEGAEMDKKEHYTTVLTGTPTEDLISALPAPRKLSSLITELRRHLETFPKALVGEIGIDRGFRIPFPDSSSTEAHAVYTPGDAEDGKRLTNHRVSMEHQKKIFVAQLKLAGELNRAVSVHGVQCHGALFDIFRELWRGHEVEVESRKEMKKRRRRAKGGGEGHEYLPDIEDSEEDSDNGKKGQEDAPKPYPPRICLHSFSAPAQTLQQYLTPPSPKKRYPSRVFFSFSSTINARPEKGHMEKIVETVKGVPTDRVLVESDLHAAGEEMDAALEGAVRVVAGIKGMGINECVKMLGENWREFVFGDVS
ncbi:Metallo-dependent hydrolase [Choiromyces venosus 120613-1]|uniref:Metallo-dependent hydrolase n=1 Tax=Choiromyces venosus 120613-1 TaxID=1336337 RepID=A0A3N4JS89_9PEZI|nr:Metallo-dependent hydrolase [Choiromyces venosus 120613-1]